MNDDTPLSPGDYVLFTSHSKHGPELRYVHNEIGKIAGLAPGSNPVMFYVDFEKYSSNRWDEETQTWKMNIPLRHMIRPRWLTKLTEAVDIVAIEYGDGVRQDIPERIRYAPWAVESYKRLLALDNQQLFDEMLDLQRSDEYDGEYSEQQVWMGLFSRSIFWTRLQEAGFIVEENKP